MAYTVALAGKGGTGKTTLAGLLIKYMVKTGKAPVLAVDADSNYNFNEVLGLEVPDTIGDAREDMKKGNVPSGMTKDVFMTMRMEEAVIETSNYDLIVMGQPEGQGCYCAANNLLTHALEQLSDNYPYIVMDNEAGMEHISRLTTKNVNVLLIVTDASRRGLQAALRINDLASELSIGVERTCLVFNQAKNGIPDKVTQMVEEAGIELLGSVDEDPSIYEYDFEGTPIIDLPEENQSVNSAFALFEKIF
ncbi:MAG: AAA family ATPase [Desulfobacterales bacterium]|nr:AAA family ATPase [Desulfobacterales bacterium]